MKKLIYSVLVIGVLFQTKMHAEIHGNSTNVIRSRTSPRAEEVRTWKWNNMQLVDAKAEEAEMILSVLKRLNSFKRIETENGKTRILHWVERVRCKKITVVTRSSVLFDEPSYECYFNDSPVKILGGNFAKDFAESLEKAGAVTESYTLKAISNQEATITEILAQQLICSESNSKPQCSFWVGKK